MVRVDIMFDMVLDCVETMDLGAESYLMALVDVAIDEECHLTALRG